MFPSSERFAPREPAGDASSPTAVSDPAPDAIAYRPDVDGLRAVAITSVVAFHAGLSLLPGGFVGVDVFFVISGYLIGAQIFRQTLAGHFRYSAFYARRLRRIVPALAAMLIGFMAVGLLLLTPAELRQLGKEVVAAAIGASNLLYFLGGDYFAPAADYNPLLMTWSLGIEEQFYIILPVMALLLLRALRARPAPALLVITLVSFAASIALTTLNTRAAFFLLPTRFWELSLGAFIAVAGWDSGQDLRRWRPALCGAVGGVLIIVGMLAYRPAIAFPGVFVLLPTLGAALLLCSQGSWVNRVLLANPAAVFIGRISYSWYLWHWPVFYLSRVLGLQEAIHPLALAAASLGLGAASWWLVEQPLRRRRLTDRAVVMRYACLVAGVAAMGAVLYQQDGLAGRLSPAGRASALDARITQDDPCLLRQGDNDTTPTGCAQPSGPGGRLALVGDSHGASISPGFAQLAKAQDVEFRQLTKSLCTSLWGYANQVSDKPEFSKECLAYQQLAFADIARDPGIKTVVLASRWALEMQLIVPDRTDIVGLETGLEATVTRLEALGRKVVLVQDVPNFKFDPYAEVIGDALPVRAGVRQALGGGARRWNADVSEVHPDPSRAIIARVAARHPKVRVYDPWASLCDGAGCRFAQAQSQALYYFDNQHLTRSGALAAVPPGGLALP